MLRRLLRGRRTRCLVLGLDGVGFSSLQVAMTAGVAPTLAGLARAGAFLPLDSPLPAISSVAWSSFMTASNPGRHGVFGFTQPRADSYEIYFPNSGDLHMPTLWDRAAIDGIRSLVVNLPGTYPARRINGALVAGFVAPDLRRACFPPSLAERLSELDYRIDVDVRLAETDDQAFFRGLLHVLDRRVEAMQALLGEISWSMAVLTFTELDRLQHVRYPDPSDADASAAAVYREVLSRIDMFLGGTLARFPATPVVVVSDHGFAPLRRYFNVNAWLAAEGYLAAAEFDQIEQRTRAFSLDPGRVYVNTKERFARGAVPQSESRDLADAIGAALLDVRDPDTGERPIRAAVPRREAYSGPLTQMAPNIVLVPGPGYELKASLRLPLFSAPRSLQGTHTHDDALFLSNRSSAVQRGTLHDAGATVLNILGLHSDDVDGASLVS